MKLTSSSKQYVLISLIANSFLGVGAWMQQDYYLLSYIAISFLFILVIYNQEPKIDSEIEKVMKEDSIYMEGIGDLRLFHLTIYKLLLYVASIGTDVIIVVNLWK